MHSMAGPAACGAQAPAARQSRRAGVAPAPRTAIRSPVVAASLAAPSSCSSCSFSNVDRRRPARPARAASTAEKGELMVMCALKRSLEPAARITLIART